MLSINFRLFILIFFLKSNLLLLLAPYRTVRIHHYRIRARQTIKLARQEIADNRQHNNQYAHLRVRSGVLTNVSVYVHADRNDDTLLNFYATKELCLHIFISNVFAGNRRLQSGHHGVACRQDEAENDKWVEHDVRQRLVVSVSLLRR